MRCVSPTLVASTQVAVAPPAAGTLSSKRSAGMEPVTAGGAAFTSVRLFDSPVKLCMSQPGPSRVPLTTPVRTRSVLPVLNTAWSPLPLPKTLNSTSCHWLPRSGK